MRLGSDPEVFLQDANGSPVSSIGYINADKWNPMQIPDMPEGYTLQEDNVALEYGIPPASSADEFVEHIQSVMAKSLDYLPELSFSKLSCIIFPEEQMQHPAAYVFGCEPDFNAWTQEMNPKPNPPHPLMRSAGGHVHVETKVDSVQAVRAMDLFLSVPAVLMDNGEMRKKLYGKAGAYRPKPYGVEYRSLSNFWVFDDQLIRWVWRNTERALQAGDVSHEMERILAAVNNGDKKIAQDLINDYNLEVV